MAGVNIVMSANTERYVANIRKAQAEGNKSFEDMGKKAQEFGDGVSNAFNSPGSAVQGLLSRLGPVGMALGGLSVALGGATAAAMAAGQAVAGTQKQIQGLASMAGISVSEMNKQAMAAKTMGFEMDTLGDIFKDTEDRIGEFLTNGGGPLSDYLSAIDGKIKRTKKDFQGLGALDALKMIQKDLDDVGTSASQQRFVLESIASDASKLSPLLRSTQQDVDNLLKGYATKRATLAQGTIDDINRTQSNIEVMQNNFNALLTNSMIGLIAMVGKVSKAIADELGESAERSKTRGFVSSVNSGDVGNPSKSNAKDFIENEAALRADIQSRYFQKEWDNISQSEKMDATRAGKMEELQKQARERAAIASQDEVKALDDKIAKAKELAALNTPSNTSTAPSALADTNDQKKAIEDAAKTREEALKLTYATEEEVAIAAHQKLTEQLNEYLRSGALTQAEFDKAEIIAATEHAKKLEDIEKNKQKAISDERTKAHADRMADINLLKEFSTNAEDIANQELLAKRAQIEESYRLDQERGVNSVLTEEDKNNKLAELDRNYQMQKFERDNEFMLNQEAAKVLYYEQEAVLLRQQLENNEITQQEFDARSVENQRNVTEAKKTLIMSELETYSSLFDGAASLAAEGSKQQKVLFAMSKAATIANMTLASFDAWAAVDKDPTLVTGLSKGIAKAKVGVEYAAKLGSVAGLTMGGQFHSGTDSVPYANGQIDSTNSFILAGGERVIQPEANKDLTAYLADKKSGGNEVIINSDLVVQGDTTISNEKFQQMLAQHRESIVQLSDMYRRERGF